MVRRSALVLVAGSLFTFAGCKKEEPATAPAAAAPEPAKAPAADPAKDAPEQAAPPKEAAPADAAAGDKAAAMEIPEGARHVEVQVTDEGFVPARIDAKVGETVVLDITRKTDETCATNLMIPDKNVKLDLPLDTKVSVPVEVGQAGTIKFGCQMGMMIGGVIVAK